MEIPNDVKTHEFSTSIIWKDKEGFWVSVPKKGVPPKLSREETDKEIERFTQMTGGEKICLISEANPEQPPPTKQERDVASEILNPLLKAMAIITSSPVTRMVVNLFYNLKPAPYPIKMFSNYEDAREWIRQYL